MRKDFETLFSRSVIPDPPPGLFERVIGRIDRERRLRTARRNIAAFALVLVAAAAGFASSVLSLQAGLAESGFGAYLRLLFSDWGAVMASWPDFSYALLESLPVAGLAACLAMALLFLATLKRVSADITVLRRA